MVSVDMLDRLVRDDFDCFAQRMFPVTQPGVIYEHSWHIECISEHLQAMWRGEITRLIINLPPRSLKSYLVSQAFPAWVLGKNPAEKFINVSYGLSVVEQNAMKCRAITKSPMYQRIFPNFKIGDLDRILHFETTMKGHYYADTALSAITGIGCFVAGTMVATNKGDIPIENLDKINCNSTLILSFCHHTGDKQYQRLRGFREKTSSEIIEIRTNSGCMFRCTPDHPIYVSGRGYQRADNLQKGDRLVSDDRHPMLGMRERGDKSPGGNKQENQERLYRRLLLQTPFLRSPCHQERRSLRKMRRADAHAPRQAVLFERMPSRLFNVACTGLQTMRGVVQTLYGAQAILRENMRECRSLRANETTQSASRIGRVTCPDGEENQTNHPQARQLPVRRMFNRFSPYHAPHRRKTGKQYTGESDNLMLPLPYEAPSRDAISSIKRYSGESVKVYDITVEGNHNFFANGVLAHNCNYMTIDDPLRPMEALSDTVRNSTNENIRATLLNRFDDKRIGKLLMVMQRVHTDDPTGNLMKDMKDKNITLLKLPGETKTAIHVRLPTPDKVLTWDMPENSLLFPTRLSREILDQLRVDMTNFHYSGQIMQEPVPLGGGEFKDTWVQYYEGGTLFPAKMNIAILCDPAGGEELNKKKKKTSDWTAFMVVGLSNDNNYYLLDIVRDRLNPSDRIDTLFTLHRKWNGLAGKSPKVGYEKYGMMTDTHYLREKQKREGYMFPLIELGGQMIKEERIRRLIPDMQQGRWYFPATLLYVDNEGRQFDLASELVNSEMKTFPKGRFDDMMDALSRIYEPEMGMIFPRLQIPKDKSVSKMWDNKEDASGWLGY